MAAQYIIRMDDFAPEMNYENFLRIKILLDKEGIKPIIGVIPHNEDNKLVREYKDKGISEVEFWEIIKKLQTIDGWSIALHGYNHVYENANSGILKINNYSEFAGVPYERQQEKIRKGIKIFEEHGIRIDAFMAPAHSFDWNTVKILKEEGIDVITDGKCAFPYIAYGMKFIPQVWAWPRKRLFGIETVCLHINSWNDAWFSRFSKAITKYRGRFCCFSIVADEISMYDTIIYRLFNIISKGIFKVEEMIMKVVVRLRNRK